MSYNGFCKGMFLPIILYTMYYISSRAQKYILNGFSSQNGLNKRMQNEFEMIWSILKFCARTDARTYAYAQVFLPEFDRTDIDLDLDKYE